MRPSLAVAVSASGCISLFGRYDVVERVIVEEDGTSTSVADAGFLDFSSNDEGSVLWRYDYDPAAMEFVPVEQPIATVFAWRALGEASEVAIDSDLRYRFHVVNTGRYELRMVASHVERGDGTTFETRWLLER